MIVGKVRMCEIRDLEEELIDYQDSLKKRKAIELKLQYDLRKISLDISKLRDKLKDDSLRL